MRRGGRPVFLDLRAMRWPPGAVASILHRASGLLLFLSIPLALWVLERSLEGPEGFGQVRALLGGWPGRLPLALLAWALAHHLAAGVRFLLMDAGLLGHGVRAGRASAWVAVTAGAVGLLAAAWGLLS